MIIVRVFFFLNAQFNVVGQVLREGKEKYDKTLGPYLDPVIRPAVAAVNVGVSAVNMSTSAASAVVNSGKQSVN